MDLIYVDPYHIATLTEQMDKLLLEKKTTLESISSMTTKKEALELETIDSLQQQLALYVCSSISSSRVTSIICVKYVCI